MPPLSFVRVYVTVHDSLGRFAVDCFSYRRCSVAYDEAIPPLSVAIASDGGLGVQILLLVGRAILSRGRDS